jgi:hypothetical protein
MMRFRLNLLWIWAARDIVRRPFETALLGTTLMLLVALTATALLLTEALSNTAAELLEAGPSIVVRRVNAGGWTPMPVEEGLRIARSIPGITQARVRIWGVAAGPAGTVTVVGVNDETAESILPEKSELRGRAPGIGEAVIGPGVSGIGNEGVIDLTGYRTLELKIVGKLDSGAGTATQDIVLLHQEDARVLLGIPTGHASDLALKVFHDEEQEAIIPDLAAAFPWPVRISTRKEAVGSYSAGFARRGGIVYITITPALLGLALLVAGVVRERIGRRYEVGLLKAMGWTSTDVVKLQMFRAMLIGAPAAALGMLAAYALVFRPGVLWPGYLLLGWKESPPSLTLNASGASMVLLEVGALVILPFLLATFWQAIKGAAADPQDLLEGNHE